MLKIQNVSQFIQLLSYFDIFSSSTAFQRRMSAIPGSINQHPKVRLKKSSDPVGGRRTQSLDGVKLAKSIQKAHKQGLGYAGIPIVNEDNREKRRLLNQSLKTELDMLLMIKKQQRQKTWMVKDSDLGSMSSSKYINRGNVQLSVRLEAEESIIRTRIEMLNQQLKELELECLDVSNQVLSEEEIESDKISKEETREVDLLEIPPVPAPRSKNSSRSVSPMTPSPTQEELDMQSRKLCEELGYPVEFI